MFSLFVDVCKKGIEMFVSYKKNEQEDRLRVAEILLDISKILDDTADKLSQDFYPHNNCIIMERLSSELKNKIKPFMTDEQSDILELCLKDVVFLEKQFANRKDPDTIPSIRSASGEFQAMSILLRF
jgi:vesicle coat complex subunit